MKCKREHELPACQRRPLPAWHARHQFQLDSLSGAQSGALTTHTGFLTSHQLPCLNIYPLCQAIGPPRHALTGRHTQANLA